jgi:hypothetical protein
MRRIGSERQGRFANQDIQLRNQMALELRGRVGQSVPVLKDKVAQASQPVSIRIELGSNPSLSAYFR